jgi:hypothetical protein
LGEVGKKVDSLALVMRSGKVLREIVCEVGAAWGPVHIKMFLLYSVTDPVVSHVNGSRSLLFDRVVGNAIGSRVVGADWCGRLGMAHVKESLAENGAFFAVDKKGSVFCFGSGGGNVA